MPYIPAEDRALPYQEFISELCEETGANFKSGAAQFFYAVLTAVYGDAERTRYFRQNELHGVLACMRMEWEQRWCPKLDTRDWHFPLFELAQGAQSLCALAARVVECIPREDETRRAGHLNYFITLLMVEAVSRRLLTKEEVPPYIDAIASQIYAVVTRPYEVQAIGKNGDVFPENF